MTENTSYDVYLWQNEYGDFEDEAIEKFDGKNEVRMHEGKPPITVIAKPSCWGCGSEAFVRDHMQEAVLCSGCGFKVFTEVFHDRRWGRV